MIRRDLPRIHFYDQDFVDIYNKTQVWVSDCFSQPAGFADKMFVNPDSEYIEQENAVFSSFFLAYFNKNLCASAALDYFYSKQEESGAIRSIYSLKDGEPFYRDDNSAGVGLPLFGWAEFNHYHKSASKKRVREVMPTLEKYNAWLDSVFMRDNGLYETPSGASGWWNSPRSRAAYLIDFNACAAANAQYMSVMLDMLNDKEGSIRYKQKYFALKTAINSYMWDKETGFYYDLDSNREKIKVKTLAGYWPLVAEIPNAEKADRMIARLSDPLCFGSPHPFPAVSMDEPSFDEAGSGYAGSVYPQLNYIVIKGLDKYDKHDLAREAAIRHLYYILDSMNPDGDHHKGALWEAYLPKSDGAAALGAGVSSPAGASFPRKHYLVGTALSTICLMIEDVIGIITSLPKKTVDWIVPNLELMGIENLLLKKNFITIRSNKSSRGWELQMESEKLYYFTVNIIGQKEKRLPIPSGKCSMLIDKL